MTATLQTRRHFLQTGGRCLFAGTVLSRFACAAEPGTRLFSAMGIAAPLDKAAELKQQGVDFLTESVGSFLVPDKPDAEFEKNLARLADSPLPVLACNGFIRPADLHCVGPDANPDRVLEWADITFRRMKRAKGKFVVFGSSGARQIPEGWTKEKADSQFVPLLRKMGPLAEAQGITLVVEQLQQSECNYINHIAEGAAIIRAVGHPNVRMLADLYHISVMGDTPADLAAAMDVIVHVEIAEKDGRTVPAVNGDDFRPYFHALKKAGYHGAISIEGKWTTQQVGPAFKEIARQAADA